MKIWIRKIHRWLGLIMALQIIAWMGSGLYFSLVPIEEVRGEHLTVMPQPLVGEVMDVLPPLPAVSSALDAEFSSGWTLQGLSPHKMQGRNTWKVTGTHDGAPFSRLVDGTGVLAKLDSDGAARVAEVSLVKSAQVESVEWVTEAPPGSEMRGRALPLWRVSFDKPGNLRLYLDPWTGDIVARRTDTWRIFDFLWMLHIMDFETRDDFNHPLLQVAALLGLLIALSGVLYWIMTTRLFRKRRAY